MCWCVNLKICVNINVHIQVNANVHTHVNVDELVDALTHAHVFKIPM